MRGLLKHKQKQGQRTFLIVKSETLSRPPLFFKYLRNKLPKTTEISYISYLEKATDPQKKDYAIKESAKLLKFTCREDPQKSGVAQSFLLYRQLQTLKITYMEPLSQLCFWTI